MDSKIESELAELWHKGATSGNTQKIRNIKNFAHLDFILIVHYYLTTDSYIN